MQLDPRLISDFVVEAQEHLEAAEPLLLAMEKSGTAGADAVNQIFRAVHSIKGAAGFLGIENVQTLTHALETLMMRLRDGEIEFRVEMTDALLSGLDKLRQLLSLLPESTGEPAAQEIALLERMAGNSPGDVPSLMKPVEPSEAPAPEAGGDEVLAQLCRDQERKGHNLAILSLPTRKAQRETLLENMARFGEVVREGHPDKRSAVVGTPLEVDLLAEALELPAEKVEVFAWRPVEPTQTTLPAADDLSKPAHLLFGQIAVDLGYLTSAERDRVLAEQSRPDQQWRSFGAVGVSLGLLNVDELDYVRAEQLVRVAAHAAEQGAEAGEEPGLEGTPGPQERRADTIRVSVALLDKLMNLAGELVLGRNQLRQLLETTTKTDVKAVLQNINLITSELQENIMNTRMQPIRVLFDRLPRLTRDIALKLGKNVQLETVGGDVELDRSIIEALGDPMTHLIRNALDHGLEDPAGRSVLGKSESGHLWVRAYHERGRVVIEVEDDGRGIDPVKVKESAVERGAITREQANQLSEKDAVFLIFQAGLSTAASVTDVSGRGVGMDVVRTNIQNLGGQIDVDSAIGDGTTFRVHLPLTLAIIPSLIVSVSEERFAIPQVNVVEVVRLRGESQLERVRDTEVLRLRGKLLPLVRLRRALGVEGEPEGHQNVVILRSGQNAYGLVVDDLHDSEEIVVKPLSSYLSECGWYAGATILGDGRVAMILDAIGMAKRAEIRFDEVAEEDQRRQQLEERDSETRERRSLVVFANAHDEHFAVPLQELLRLERIQISEIQTIGTREFLTHRGRSIPLVRLEKVLPVRPVEATDEFFVLIPRLEGFDAGIVASRIVDTLETDAQPDPNQIKARGLLGSAIVHDRMTLFLDTEALLTAAGLERAQ